MMVKKCRAYRWRFAHHTRFRRNCKQAPDEIADVDSELEDARFHGEDVFVEELEVDDGDVLVVLLRSGFWEVRCVEDSKPASSICEKTFLRC